MSCAAGLNVCVSLSVMCELHATDDIQGILCRFLKKKTQRRRQRGQRLSREAGGQAAGSRKIHTWKHRERSKHKTSSVRGLWWQTHGTSEVVCFFYGLCWGLQRIGPVICSFKSHKATFTLLCVSSNLGSDLVHIICETITARSGVMAASLYIIVIKR